MRKAFVDTLIELMEQDEKIWLLTGDLGFGAFEPLIEKFPDRFINCGIAEQNMMGVAAGLAIEGKKPYVYSIIPFVILRCLEQIRNDVCYQNLNVKIIGIGGNQRYKILGFSHNLEGKENEEDLLKNLPNIKRYYPRNKLEASKAIIKSYEEKTPAYIRL